MVIGGAIDFIENNGKKLNRLDRLAFWEQILHHLGTATSTDQDDPYNPILLQQISFRGLQSIDFSLKICQPLDNLVKEGCRPKIISPIAI